MSIRAVAISTRYAPLIAAVLMAAVCWLSHTLIVVLLNGESVLAALFPPLADVGGRSLMALTTASVAALGVHGYSRALRRQVIELGDNDLHYRTVLETTSDSIITINADAKIVAVNMAATRVFGAEAPAFLLLDVDDLILNINDELLPDVETFRKLLRTRTGLTGGTVNVTGRGLDGRTFPAEVNIVPASYRDKTHRLLFVRELTEQIRAREALQDSEEQLLALVENTMDIVSVINESGDVLYVSPSCYEITGYTQDELIGNNIFAAVHTDDVEAVKQLVKEGFESPRTRKSFTCRYFRADGSMIYIETVGTAFRSAAGEMRAVINTRDVTERHKTERQLRQAQKMQAIGQLTGGIAHDFNNLLTVIVGNLQMISDARLDPEAAVQLDTAMRAAFRGTDLTRQLLAFAKRQPLEPRPTDVRELVKEMQPLLHRSLGDSVDLVMEIDDDLWMAKIDPAQLEMALLNLVINSRDAIGERGRVTIRLSNGDLDSKSEPEGSLAETGEFVRVAVEDDGEGMSDLVRKSAIEPFFSTKGDSEGSGLGLSMVYGFVQQSGGHLSLSSERDRGTCVQLFLPRCYETTNRTDDKEAVADTPNGQETVLVVDDNTDVRNSAAATVARLGYDVLAASGGAEALSVLANTDVDLLFSDVKMPQMSGFELAARAQAAHPNLQVLLTSGFADATVPQTADGAAIYEFIPKPYRREQLAKKIRSLLDHDYG